MNPISTIAGMAAYSHPLGPNNPEKVKGPLGKHEALKNFRDSASSRIEKIVGTGHTSIIQKALKIKCFTQKGSLPVSIQNLVHKDLHTELRTLFALLHQELETTQMQFTKSPLPDHPLVPLIRHSGVPYKTACVFLYHVRSIYGQSSSICWLNFMKKYQDDANDHRNLSVNTVASRVAKNLSVHFSNIFQNNKEIFIKAIKQSFSKDNSQSRGKTNCWHLLESLPAPAEDNEFDPPIPKTKKEINIGKCDALSAYRLTTSYCLASITSPNKEVVDPTLLSDTDKIVGAYKFMFRKTLPETILKRTEDASLKKELTDLFKLATVEYIALRKAYAQNSDGIDPILDWISTTKYRNSQALPKGKVQKFMRSIASIREKLKEEEWVKLMCHCRLTRHHNLYRSKGPKLDATDIAKTAIEQFKNEGDSSLSIFIKENINIIISAIDSSYMLVDTSSKGALRPLPPPDASSADALLSLNASSSSAPNAPFTQAEASDDSDEDVSIVPSRKRGADELTESDDDAHFVSKRQKTDHTRDSGEDSDSMTVESS